MRPHREKVISQHIEVEVKNDDVMKAWRKLKKKLTNARILEEVKERRYYQKPSEIKRETKKRQIRQHYRNRMKAMLKD